MTFCWFPFVVCLFFHDFILPFLIFFQIVFWLLGRPAVSITALSRPQRRKWMLTWVAGGWKGERVDMNVDLFFWGLRVVRPYLLDSSEPSHQCMKYFGGGAWLLLLGSTTFQASNIAYMNIVSLNPACSYRIFKIFPPGQLSDPIERPLARWKINNNISCQMLRAMFFRTFPEISGNIKKISGNFLVFGKTDVCGTFL